MNVHHQIAATRVLHDKTDVLGSLETGKELYQERVLAPVGTLENAPLTE